MIARFASLAQDRRGATIVEFALVCPVLLLMLLGLFDMGYNYYVQSQLQGAVQQAARNSGIEGGQTDTIDARVTQAVREIAPHAEVEFSRRSYASFSDVSQPEDFSDINEDGRCNDGEPFEDANANGTWDEDRGKVGVGGARDAVLYVVTVTYARQFAGASFVGLSDEVVTQATTVLRNQPYGEQEVSELIGTCA
mgnify:CR=1 FL=1